jgi:hypothetical protein
MKPVRVPLVADQQNRSNNHSKDSRLVNGYVEKVGDKQYVIKRPGLTQWFTPTTTSSGNGMYAIGDVIYAGVGSDLYQINYYGLSTRLGTSGLLSGLTSVAGYAVAGFTAGNIGASSTSGKLYFTSTPYSYLFFHNQIQAFTYNTSTGTLATVIDSDFPTVQSPARHLVPGAVYMNNTFFVMTTDGRIYSSAIDDPTSWGALDFVTLTSEPDSPVVLSKTNNYLVAFSSNYTEFYYYSGEPTGSPISPNLPAKLEIGCAAADSVVKFPNSIVFIGSDKTAGRSVYVIEGTSSRSVSTKAIETFLNNDPLTNVSAFAVGISGHDFYVLNLANSNVSLVYDMSTGMWSEWTSIVNGVEQRFELNNFVSIGSTTFLQSETQGYIAKMDTGSIIYSDEGIAIPFRIVTPRFEGDSNTLKFFQSVELITDKVVGTLRIRHSDDDYATWSSYRTVDLNVNRPTIRQLGAARRRAFEIYDDEDKPLRILGADLLVREGTF